MIGPDGKLHPVKFSFSQTVVDEGTVVRDMENNYESGFKEDLNFVRVDHFDETTNPQVSGSSYGLFNTNFKAPPENPKDLPGNMVTSGDNSVRLPIGQIQSNPTSALHEIIRHMFGSRTTSSHIDAVQDNTNKFALGVTIDTKFSKLDSVYLQVNRFTGKTVINTQFREPTQEDIALIKPYLADPKEPFDKSKWKDNKVFLGGATNTYFDNIGYEKQVRPQPR